MNIEREKKFKVKYIPISEVYKKVWIEQFYLYDDTVTAIRKRMKKEDSIHYFYTVKSKVNCEKYDNVELEEEITQERYHELGNGYGGIEKERLYVKLPNNLVAEIDVFKGKLEGLVIAEVEYYEEDINMDLVDWLGKEIDKKEFSNSRLARIIRRTS